jgi:hypothetical protein
MYFNMVKKGEYIENYPYLFSFPIFHLFSRVISDTTYYKVITDFVNQREVNFHHTIFINKCIPKEIQTIKHIDIFYLLYFRLLIKCI